MLKLLRAILFAGISYLALVDVAHAVPLPLVVQIGGWLFTNTFLGGVFGLETLIAATQLGLTLAASAGASLVAGSLGRRPTTDPGKYRGTFEATDSSEINAIGRCRIGGLRAFGNTAGIDRYRLTLHSATPLVAIEEYYLGSRPVTVESDGNVSSPPYAKPGGSWVTWKTKSGEGTHDAWEDLIAAFPTLWTADHKALGIAQSLLKYTSPGIATAKFGKLYQGGEPPAEILGRFGRVYDPRETECDPDDPLTWIWSMNGVLCAARIMLSYPNVSVSSFDWNFIAEEADKADTLVATLTGTEPRSQCSGIWLSEDKRGDTMQEVLRSIGAEIVQSEAGLIRVRLIDDEPEAEIEYTTRHLIDWSWKSGPDAAERPNVCRVRYYSPERNYELAEIDLSDTPWARVESEIDRYGEKPMDIDLPFCPSASQAQRIARREFLLARGDHGSAILNMAGMAAWGRSYVAFHLDDLEETLVTKIAPPRCDDSSGSVDIPFIVWPQELIDEPWDPATMEAPAPDPIPSLEFEGELETPEAPIAAALVQYEDMSYELRVHFDGVEGGTTAEAVYRTSTGGLPDPYTSMTEYEGFDDDWYAYAVADVEGQDVDIKVRFFNEEDEGSHFSDPLQLPAVEVDNTALSAPHIDVVATPVGEVNTKYDVTAWCTDLNAVKLVLDVEGHVQQNDGRPGQTLSYSVTQSGALDAAAIAYTSDGTPSPVATG